METPFIKFVKDNLGKDLVGLEVGARGGTNAVYLLDNLGIKKLYLVDNWKEYRDGDGGGTYFTQEVQDAEYSVCLKNVSEYGTKVEVLRESSEDAIRRFPDNFFDFIYIDGNHKYEFVKMDMAWHKKLKKGGILGGHDYDPYCLDVIQAVNELVKENDYKLNILATRQGDNNGVEWAIIK